MPKVEFRPSGAAVEAPAGTSLMDAARMAGVPLESECGGKGTCSSCMVLLESGQVAGDSRSFLPLPAVEEGYVLACRCSLVESDVVLRHAAKATATVEGGQFASLDAAACEELDPVVRRVSLTVAQPAPEDGLSDLDRLERALLHALDAEVARLECPLPVLVSLASRLREREGRVSVVYHIRGENVRLLDVQPGAPSAPLVGAAIDLGTTSIAVQLADLESGAVLATASDYNPQLSRGLDVISRINFSQRPDGLEELRSLVGKGCNEVLARALTQCGKAPEDVMLLSMAGNTVMTHLFLGLDPEHVRLAPYTPTVHRPEPFAAAELGLAAHPRAPVLLAPSVGSYVGGDIVAGLLCTPLAEAEGGELRLFLDIGTNGEVVVGNGEFLLGCACSSGPAFEGGGLGCGMRAAQGAIERVDIDAESGEPTLKVIGGGKPAGLCGSGAIDLLAGLFKAGWLDAAGRLERERPCSHIRVQGKRAEYVLARAQESAHGEDVLLAESDIDNLLRAKAAIYAGCSLLLEQTGLGFEDVAEVIVAGGFGRYLDVETAIRIGLLPDLPRERFRFIGNSSLAGAARTLRSRTQIKTQNALAERLTYLELSTEPAYMDQYTAALFLPHTDASRFPSITGGA